VLELFELWLDWDEVETLLTEEDEMLLDDTDELLLEHGPS
jgi:hypothetical protein